MNWKHYTDTFRKLITQGFIVLRKATMPVYTYVYPNTRVPTKWRLTEAASMFNYASKFNDIAGTSLRTNIQYNLVMEDKYLEWRSKVGDDAPEKRG